VAEAPSGDGRWLVALDVDGTLVDYDQRLSDRVRDAVTAVRDAGHHVVVSTGRSIMGTTHVLTDLGLTGGLAVLSNGAVTVALDPAEPDGWRVLRTVTFDARPAVELLRRELPDALFAVEVTGVGTRVSGPWPEGELFGELYSVPFEELLDGETTRVVVRSPDHTSEHFMELVERIGLHGVTYAVGYTAWLDLAPEGVSKASALEQVRTDLGVDPARTLAVGDGRNDLEMLAWAARGVAMGNAPQVVLDAADEVAPGVEDDGLAEVLEALPAP
jgi:hydroxymethylpyrimidine pyrophosphatase-like HAD family hydrolase